MNKKQRKELEEAIGLLDKAKEIIERIGEEEQQKYDNLSDGLQQSENGQKLEESTNQLENISDSIQQAADEVQEVISN